MMKSAMKTPILRVKEWKPIRRMIKATALIYEGSFSLDFNIFYCCSRFWLIFYHMSHKCWPKCINHYILRILDFCQNLMDILLMASYSSGDPAFKFFYGMGLVLEGNFAFRNCDNILNE